MARFSGDRDSGCLQNVCFPLSPCGVTTTASRSKPRSGRGAWRRRGKKYQRSQTSFGSGHLRNGSCHHDRQRRKKDRAAAKTLVGELVSWYRDCKSSGLLAAISVRYAMNQSAAPFRQDASGISATMRCCKLGSWSWGRPEMTDILKTHYT